MEVSNGRPLAGIRCVALYARTYSVEEDPTFAVARQTLTWMAAHREVCVLRIEFDRWETPAAGSTPTQRMANALDPKGPEDGHLWNASAFVYYEECTDETPIPQPLKWRTA